MENTYILGQDVGGLTAEQAAETVRAALPDLEIGLYLYDSALDFPPEHGETPDASIPLADLGADINVDGYIKAYMGAAGDWLRPEGLRRRRREAVRSLRPTAVWYPWEEAERLKILLAQDRVQEALQLAERIYADWPENGYIVSMAAEAKWSAGQKEKAFEWWSRVRMPTGQRSG